MPSDSAVITRTPDQPWCDLGAEVVVLRIRDSAYYRFEASGRSVWLLLEQPRTFGELIDGLSHEYAGERSTMAVEVEDFLTKCTDLGLVTVAALDA
ncbi:MAG: PqqD family protein [Gemmatimonadota bacterium]